ncbi:MAG: hypothetical protein HXY22_04775 [Alphaproteobacteria bacterium]|nr:hypothetical protein [Alphaproteobacteria bacterium]
MEFLTDLWARLFTWEWAGTAALLAFLLSLPARGLLSAAFFAVSGVIADIAVPLVRPLVLTKNLPPDLPAKLEAALFATPPDLLLAKFVVYLAAIYVFSLARRDMLRPYEAGPRHHEAS